MGYFIRNLETRKLELHFSKPEYQALSAEKKQMVKQNFLFAKSIPAWVSRSDHRNWNTLHVAQSLSLEDHGETGEKVAFGDRLAAKQERAEERADRMEARSDKADAEASARFNSANVQAVRDLQGEPVKIGHHSERRHRKLLDRADNDMRKGCEAMDRSKHYAARAEAASRTASARELDDPGFLSRRIEENEAELRLLARRAKEATDEAYLDRLEELAEEANDKLAFYQSRFDLVKATRVVFTRESLKPGDEVLTRHGWARVDRCSPKNVSVTYLEGGCKGMDGKYPYPELRDRRDGTAGPKPPEVKRRRPANRITDDEVVETLCSMSKPIHGQGISGLEAASFLARKLNVTPESAWKLIQKTRNLVRVENCVFVRVTP